MAYELTPEEEQAQVFYTNAMYKREYIVRIAQEVGLVSACIYQVFIKFSNNWDHMTPEEKFTYIGILGKEAMNLAEQGFVFLDLEAFAGYMNLTVEDLYKGVKNLVDEGLLEAVEVLQRVGLRLVPQRWKEILNSERDTTYIYQFQHLATNDRLLDRHIGRQ